MYSVQAGAKLIGSGGGAAYSARRSVKRPETRHSSNDFNPGVQPTVLPLVPRTLIYFALSSDRTSVDIFHIIAD